MRSVCCPKCRASTARQRSDGLEKGVLQSLSECTVFVVRTAEFQRRDKDRMAQGHPTTVFYRMLLDAVLGYLEYF